MNGADLNWDQLSSYRLRAAVALRCGVGQVCFWNELDTGRRNLVAWSLGRLDNPDAFAYYIAGGNVQRVELETLKK